ncbi:methyltransferase domain-containing protein [Rhodococcus sp. ABRD24]|uniref:class I SAM-dependent methyltransferase n=1 Tax=Rhodococcus sp. ABRD24 TaxID=2507582 RepID=UPI00103DAD4A|nr:class I SAM-dependent methyltransferase [Rhodococcus sp. ABRD24]QBJ96213.1 methyltransferase domain-containing protein [Rhodococcus sp. ABRD24]
MGLITCRICGNSDLETVLNLGDQSLTGVFPRSRDDVVPSVPLELVKCAPPGCGLVQLRDTADFGLMYNEGYGYRSGIRPFMINHLHDKVAVLRNRVEVSPDDLVVDIGSNDSTLLRGYLPDAPKLVGFDLIGEKFRDLYPPEADLIAGFFSADAFTERYGDRRAKIVTSIAMFYDLPEPMRFMQDVHDILTDDGLWLMEQSYLASMLEAGAYDVVCHEHLEYYALAQIEWMAQRTGLKVISADITDVYGGSLCVVLAKQGSDHRVDEAGLQSIRTREASAKLDTLAPYEEFARSAERQRDQLVDFLAASRIAGKLTLGYGASTKGNVILQYCGLTEADLPCIGEVSPEKSGCYTPGTGIPIVSEEEAKARRPDQLLVLPWIYRDGFIEREKEFLANGGKLIFPLPQLEVM